MYDYYYLYYQIYYHHYLSLIITIIVITFFIIIIAIIIILIAIISFEQNMLFVQLRMILPIQRGKCGSKISTIQIDPKQNNIKCINVIKIPFQFFDCNSNYDMIISIIYNLEAKIILMNKERKRLKPLCIP